MHNPSLREEPRHQRAAVVPSRQESSILDWLESTGRLLARDVQDRTLLTEEEEIEEINALMAGDDYLEDDDIVELEE